MTEVARDLLNESRYQNTVTHRRRYNMMCIDLEKRDQMAYRALFYAIHGDVDRSEKIRAMLRRSLETRERVPVVTREFA